MSIQDSDSQDCIFVQIWVILCLRFECNQIQISISFGEVGFGFLQIIKFLGSSCIFSNEQAGFSQI